MQDVHILLVALSLPDTTEQKKDELIEVLWRLLEDTKNRS